MLFSFIISIFKVRSRFKPTISQFHPTIFGVSSWFSHLYSWAQIGGGQYPGRSGRTGCGELGEATEGNSLGKIWE